MSKGFRSAKKPSKGQLNQQNMQLMQQLMQMTQTLMKVRNEQSMLTSLIRHPLVNDGLQDGDFVMIDFMGRLIEEDGSLGELIEGGLGGSFVIQGLGKETLVPGFEEQLVGKNVGDTLEVDVEFPKDYNAETLKGKKARFFVGIIHARRPNAADSYVEDTYKEYLEAKKAETEAAAESNESNEKAEA